MCCFHSRIIYNRDISRVNCLCSNGHKPIQCCLYTDDTIIFLCSNGHKPIQCCLYTDDTIIPCDVLPFFSFDTSCSVLNIANRIWVKDQKLLIAAAQTLAHQHSVPPSASWSQIINLRRIDLMETLWGKKWSKPQRAEWWIHVALSATYRTYFLPDALYLNLSSKLNRSASTRRLHLGVPHLQVSCSGLTSWQGSSICSQF